MQATGIEWTDVSSNPLKYRDAAGKVVWGCAKVSAGCQHCYSEAIAKRYNRGGPFNLPTVEKLTPFVDEAEVRKLLRSKNLAGKRVFLCDMTDLFGEWVSDELIDRVFAMMALRPDVTFQVLTKRAERMCEYLCGDEVGIRWARLIPEMTVRKYWDICADEALGWSRNGLPNCWLGVSVESQEQADKRIPHLLATPAAVRFLSVEPLLGPVDLRVDETVFFCLACGQVTSGNGGDCANCGDCRTRERCYLDYLNWVIVGGESGSGARPCDVDWVRSLVEQCDAADVACFVKQLGAMPVTNTSPNPNLMRGIGPHDAEGDPVCWRCGHFDFGPCGDGTLLCNGCNAAWNKLKDKKGGDMAEWPADLRVREFPK